MAAVTACDVLCDAKNLIAKGEWIRKAEKMGEAYCLKGACHEAIRLKKLTQPEASLLTEIVLMHLAVAIKPTHMADLTKVTWSTVTNYNDTIAKTKADVLRTLDAAGACDAD